MSGNIANIDVEDRRLLEEAVGRLETPSLASRLSNLLGTPLEKAFDMLPAGVASKINDITQASLEKALDAAVYTMKQADKGTAASSFTHKLMAGVSGAVGGAFGLPALAIELPISTGIMLRSVADIARSEGESLDDPATRAACLEVFALGSRSPEAEDDKTDTGYFAVRMALAASFTEAAGFAGERALVEGIAPAMMQVVGAVARKFNAAVTQKFAAQSVPAIGAVGGATVNWLFMDHFQETARGHFVVRRMEKKYGAEAVRQAYDSIRKSSTAKIKIPSMADLGLGADQKIKETETHDAAEPTRV